MKNQIIITWFLILLFSTTIYAQDELKDTSLVDYFGRNFSIQLFAGFSSLKVVPDAGLVADLDYKLPRISMNTYGFRFGIRNFFKNSISIFGEIAFSTSKGKLNFEYSDPAIPFEYTGIEINQETNVSNTMIGGAIGISVPLYKQLNSSAFYLAPKAILLDLKVGADAMILGADNNEIGPINYARFFANGGSQYGAIGGEIITTGDWVLFSLGMGVDYMMTKNLMIKFEIQIGAYPVSGPADTNFEPTGPPDTWGKKRMASLGLEFLF